MEKEMYERAEMEVVEFEVEDVITTSGGTGEIRRCKPPLFQNYRKEI